MNSEKLEVQRPEPSVVERHTRPKMLDEIGMVITVRALPESLRNNPDLITVSLRSGVQIAPTAQFGNNKTQNGELSVDPYIAAAWKLLQTWKLPKWSLATTLFSPYNDRLTSMAEILSDPDVPSEIKQETLEFIITKGEEYGR